MGATGVVNMEDKELSFKAHEEGADGAAETQPLNRAMIDALVPTRTERMTSAGPTCRSTTVSAHTEELTP
jgi:hypothetical protein